MSNISSPFYCLLEPNFKCVLEYPFLDNLDFSTLDFNGEGEQAQWEIVDELVLLVPLGDGRYRLAEKLEGPFSALPMSWSDEFFAVEDSHGSLRFRRMASPQKFAHLRLTIAEPFVGDGLASDLIHLHGGGWETVAGGMLTVTVPIEKQQMLIDALSEAKVLPTGVQRR